MARLLLALTFALALFVPATQATDQRILGKKLLIKNPSSGAAGNKLVHLGKDVAITVGTTGSSGDPTCSGAGGGGGSLRIAASGGAGDVTIPLPCGGWTTNAANTLYKYRDTTNTTCTHVLVKSGALAKAICKGSQVGIDLNGSMSPTIVVTTLNANQYCAEYGGDVVKDGNDDRTFLRKNAPPPAACPSTTSTSTTSTTTTSAPPLSPCDSTPCGSCGTGQCYESCSGDSEFTCLAFPPTWSGCLTDQDCASAPEPTCASFRLCLLGGCFCYGACVTPCP